MSFVYRVDSSSYRSRFVPTPTPRVPVRVNPGFSLSRTTTVGCRFGFSGPKHLVHRRSCPTSPRDTGSYLVWTSRRRRTLGRRRTRPSPGQGPSTTLRPLRHSVRSWTRRTSFVDQWARPTEWCRPRLDVNCSWTFRVKVGVFRL